MMISCNLDTAQQDAKMALTKHNTVVQPKDCCKSQADIGMHYSLIGVAVKQIRAPCNVA